MSEAESDRRDKVESWVLFATADTGDALTDVETAIRHADGLTRERLIRARSALIEATQHLGAIYAAPVRVLRQP